MNNDKIIYVPTDKIKKISVDTFFDISKPPMVDGGDWDINNLKDIEKEFIVYTSLYKLINGEAEWEDTELYQYMVDYLHKGKPQWGCDTLEKCKNRKEYLLNLYEDIKNIGRIISREELKNKKGIRSKRSFMENDYIQVAIGRFGQILFAQNGSHRLCISKILGFKFVPVKVCRRHIEWENYRKHVFNVCNENWNGKTYQTLPHPDFDEIVPIHNDYRYDMVFDNTLLRNVKLLDIGSLFGNICYQAECDGFKCTAVEPSKIFSDVMKKLHAAMDMKYKIVESSVFALDDKKHDIIVAFNIFHHFLKSETMYNNLKKLLNELEYKEMFIEMHTRSEKQMIGAYKNYGEEEFCRFIIENSKNKSNFECVGKENDRKIYKIY